MLLGSGEAVAHGAQAEVGGAQVAPAGDEGAPLVGGAPADVELRLEADGAGVAAGFAGVVVDAGDGRAHRLVRLPPGEPAVADLADPAQGRLGVAADPDRDRALDRQRVDPGRVDPLPLPVEGDRPAMVQRARSRAICSSLRAPRLWKSLSSPSYSTSFQPTPTPSRSRPPLRTSISAACLATSAVCRCGRISDAGDQLQRRGQAGQVAEEDEDFVERILGAYAPVQPGRTEASAPRTWS